MSLMENFNKAKQELLGAPAEELSKKTVNSAAPLPTPDKRPPSNETAPQSRPPVQPAKQPVYETTVIAVGSHVNGVLSCKGSVNIFGSVKGDVTSEQDVALHGRLEGAAVCRGLTMSCGKMAGNITAAGKVVLDAESVLVGDVEADHMVLNGKVKGNLNIRHSLTMGECAQLQGDLSAAALAVSEGSVIRGQVLINSEHAQQLPQPDVSLPPLAAQPDPQK